MRRVLQVCGVAAVLASVAGVQAPAAGAQGIISGITLPPISAVTPGMSGMPVEVAVAVPSLVSQPIMPGIGAGLAGTGSGGEREVTYKVSTTSEPATIELSE